MSKQALVGLFNKKKEVIEKLTHALSIYDTPQETKRKTVEILDHFRDMIEAKMEFIGEEIQ